MRKLDLMIHDIAEPIVEGSDDAEITLVGWGSTYGPIHEARLLLEAEGHKVNHLHFHEIWPFPTERAEPVLNRARRIVDIENNYTGQLARLIRTETGINIEHKILKYNGRVFMGDEIAERVRNEVMARV
ncbi:MAG: 2-oxoglutarate/2-oxoacid ferredoxin oxidoreductase subunit alpha [Chloroflexota bacterium]|nr:2-oxoglutarate/2-oxoacid ferredoxin oxidoreductase subunit alpha [Chloroflexota bacterium]